MSVKERLKEMWVICWKLKPSLRQIPHFSRFRRRASEKPPEDARHERWIRRSLGTKTG